MTQIVVTISQKRLKLAQVEKLVEKMFPNASVHAKKVVLATSRAERLAEAEGFVEEAKSIVEELRSEIEQWKSGMEGTNLESTSKYEELEGCEQELQQILDDLDSPDFSQVSFPSMF